MLNYKERYSKSHYNYTLQRTPNVIKDGFYSPPKIPLVKKSGGLSKFCENYCNWSGHFLERTNTMGVPIQKKIPKFDIFQQKLIHFDGGIEWRKGSGIKGSSDLKGHINNPQYKFPIPIYIEIKIKDKQSDYQKEYEKMVTKTGALYAIVHNPEEFFVFIDYVMGL
jgi:hypothetical protein